MYSYGVVQYKSVSRGHPGTNEARRLGHDSDPLPSGLYATGARLDASSPSGSQQAEGCV